MRLSRSGQSARGEESDLQETKKVCDNILDAVQEHINEYKNYAGIAPPADFATVHKQVQELYVVMLENLFRLADEIVALGTLTPEQMKKRAGPGKTITIQLKFTIPDSLLIGTAAELKRLAQRYLPVRDPFTDGVF